MSIWVQESAINRTENYTLYNGFDVTWDSETDEPAEVYRKIVETHEYGRCTGKVYIDTENGAMHCGWVFQKRAKYDDCNETFLQETWFTLRTHAPYTSMGSAVPAS